MPNWCYNQMTITGKTDDLRKFRNDITVSEPTDDNPNATKLSMKTLFPCPAELHEYNSPLRTSKDGTALSDDEVSALSERFIAMYGSPDWYSWQNDNWGTKWGDCDTASDEEIKDGDTSLSVYYETAWSPATGLIAKISSLYPQLVFSVFSTEESDAFVCYQVFHKGTLVGEQESTTEMPQEIAEMPTETSEELDEYYEALNDWQCERNDKISNGVDKFVENYLNQIKAQRDKVEYQYKVKMIRLVEEMENALKEFEVCEVITTTK